MGAPLNKKPLCHPKRKHYCVDLCRQCYNAKYYKENKVASKEHNIMWRKRNKEKYAASHRKTELWRLYRLTPEEWEVINQFQKKVCAITGDPPVNTRLYTDHDHKTGLIRGLLSMRVNRGMAYFNDDPALLRKAADYLENPPAVIALGKKVYGLLGKAKHKKKMVYGSENRPIKTRKA